MGRSGSPGSIRASNNAPVAVADSYSTPQDTALVQAAPGVLTNDTDADSNPLTAVLNANVTHGTLALNANGGFTYTPTAGYSGPDSFTYHANDGTADSNIVTVSLTVTAPPAPLRGWWQFENNVLDSSTYGNNGTLVAYADVCHWPGRPGHLAQWHLPVRDRARRQQPGPHHGDDPGGMDPTDRCRS